MKLLSAIKLFFTFGKKTIFFCGIDKKAVTEAVKTKYGEVVKANEYLEKVFDVSFTMPQEYDISKLVHFYFDKEYSDVHGNKVDLLDKITAFLKELHFTNPRRIKKILNKYLLIQNLVEKNVETSIKLPNILTEESGTLFETYLTLYLLILKEFENNVFENFLNTPFLRIKTGEAVRKYNEEKNKNDFFDLKDSVIDKDLNSFNFYKGGGDYYSQLLSFFIPINVNTMRSFVIERIEYFNESLNVYEKNYDYFFLKFMMINENEIIKD